MQVKFRPQYGWQVRRFGIGIYWDIPVYTVVLQGHLSGSSRDHLLGWAMGIMLVHTGMSIYWYIPVYTSWPSQQIIAGSSEHHAGIYRIPVRVYAGTYRYILDPQIIILV